MKDKGNSYVTTVTRFFCGCCYVTPTDQAVFCPQHRGFITGREQVRHQERQAPPWHGVVKGSYTGGPAVLMNTERNSVHVKSTVLDGRREEWSMGESEEVGICAACFIESDGGDRRETEVAMCECGNEDCSYRWCGQLDGLHAFWRLHVNGETERATGIDDRDIFSYGPCEGLKEEVQETLKQERDSIRKEADRLGGLALRAQTAGPGELRRVHPVYLTNWLSRECRAIASPSREGDMNREMQGLLQKVARLHVLGAMPPQTGE